MANTRENQVVSEEDLSKWIKQAHAYREQWKGLYAEAERLEKQPSEETKGSKEDLLKAYSDVIDVIHLASEINKRIFAQYNACRKFQLALVHATELLEEFETIYQIHKRQNQKEEQRVAQEELANQQEIMAGIYGGLASKKKSLMAAEKEIEYYEKARNTYVQLNDYWNMDARKKKEYQDKKREIDSILKQENRELIKNKKLPEWNTQKKSLSLKESEESKKSKESKKSSATILAILPTLNKKSGAESSKEDSGVVNFFSAQQTDWPPFEFEPGFFAEAQATPPPIDKTNLPRGWVTSPAILHSGRSSKTVKKQASDQTNTTTVAPPSAFSL